jgi:hypothetical protein
MLHFISFIGLTGQMFMLIFSSSLDNMILHILLETFCIRRNWLPIIFHALEAASSSIVLSAMRPTV